MAEAPTAATPRTYRKVRIAVGIGTLIEVYDNTLYGILAVFLAGQFFPQRDPAAALLATFAIYALGFLIRPLGAVVFGHVGDRIGRRPALALSLLLMTAATTALGLLPTYASVGLLAPILLVLCRLVQGLSASAELPGANVLLMEHGPSDRPGRAAALVTVTASLGVTVSVGTGLVLSTLLSPAQLSTWGWRVAFLAAAPLGVIGLYIRNRLMDTPAFLALSAAERRASPPLVRTLRTGKRHIAMIVIWLATGYIGGYVLVGYMPTYLIRVVGLAPAHAYAAGLIVTLIGPLSTLTGGYLIDRFPLRRVAVGAMAGIAVTALPGFWIITRFQNLGAAIVGPGLWALFVGTILTIGAVLSLTLFPAAIRFTGTAITINLAITVFGSTAPYISTTLVTATHNPNAPGYYLLAAAIIGLLAGLVGLPHGRAQVPRV